MSACANRRQLPGAARARKAAPHRAVRRRLQAGCGALTALLVSLTVAACGYHWESPRLPGNAGTIAFADIRNRTLTGEVDVRLAHRLRALLLKHPGIQLTTPDHSDLVLDIELTVLRIVRTRDLATTSLTGVSYQLAGQVSVYDRRTRQYYVYHEGLQGISTLNFDSPTVETPAIRDEGLDDAIQDFALKVEDALFLSF